MKGATKQLTVVLLFAVAMAYVEAAVVVYLRQLYYPGGFSFPLQPMPNVFIAVELGREFATLVMLATVTWLAGRTSWSRFAWFLAAFGVWDIFYYIWLKVTLDWPASILDWDILFLIPLPWIGPVIAPVLIAVLMIVAGLMILRIENRGRSFKPPQSTWIISLIGTGIILYSFMHDTDATLRFQHPEPYAYSLLIVGLVCYLIAMALSYRRTLLTP